MLPFCRFILASAGHFMMVNLDRNAHLLQQQTHFGPHVLETVYRRHREITALYGRTMTGIATFHLESRRPGTFFGIDLEKTAGHIVFPANTVKDEKFRFRSEKSHIANA